MEHSATLKVRVATSELNIPLEGVTVAVTRIGQTGKHDLLSVQVTDCNGEIRPVQVAALTGSDSGQGAGNLPGQEQCQLWAEYPGYAVLRVEGLALCPGGELVQQLELTPLSPGQCTLRHREVKWLNGQGGQPQMTQGKGRL